MYERNTPYNGHHYQDKQQHTHSHLTNSLLPKQRGVSPQVTYESWDENDNNMLSISALSFFVKVKAKILLNEDPIMP